MFRKPLAPSGREPVFILLKVNAATLIAARQRPSVRVYTPKAQLTSRYDAGRSVLRLTASWRRDATFRTGELSRMHAATAFEPVVLARSVPFQHPARPLDRAQRRRRVEAFLRSDVRAGQCAPND